MPRGDPLRGRHERPSSSGRKPGQKNRATRELRGLINGFLQANQENLGVWLDQVAEGIPARVVDGRVVHRGVAPDPARAVELLPKIAEFAAPKATALR